MSFKNKDGIYVSKERIACYDVSRFDDTAENVKAYIDSIVEKAKEMGMVGEGRFSFNAAAYGYDRDEYLMNVYYEFERLETEKEKAKREKTEEKRKEAAVAKRKATVAKKKLKADEEYQEFLRLKEKFRALEE